MYELHLYTVFICNLHLLFSKPPDVTPFFGVCVGGVEKTGTKLTKSIKNIEILQGF